MSVETAAAIIVLLITVASLPVKNEFSPTGLTVTQVASDLLIAWARGNSTFDEMREDAEWFIGKEGFILEAHGKKNRGFWAGDVITHEIIVFRGGRADKIRLSIIEKQGS